MAGNQLLYIIFDSNFEKCINLQPLSCFQEVRFTLDRCFSAIVMETEGVETWAMTEDRSSCEARGVTPNKDRLAPTPSPPP